MKKIVVVAAFVMAAVYMTACNKEALSPDSIANDIKSAATADSTKHKHPKKDSLGIKRDSLGHKPPKDSLGVKPPKLDSLKTKPPKLDSLGHKPKKGPKHG
ncbi:hypothetical protein Emtol_3565 [Emticicia oligotrophica DSM 17448]|uniref:Uncharacterized protein n=1 Tax=Emticicia oligotrophica (strain DSM 17448 / CIP 109782 / MTCC 6937 / GPTSA100-15) TaxID=929562 RepID=A0ABM5N5K4_EMTOG|nr:MULTISPECIES: hypothetical protein [Emticicia]AFK04691.1 hypothetical protein Emtol_3565 [Emticicia oligotrophica DSM 17448]